MKDCRSCRDHKDCIGKEWYTIFDVRFCPFQIEWIIEHSETLREGIWPPSPNGSGYVDPAIKTGNVGSAYYTKPTEILAEVEARLRRTGKDGIILWYQIKQQDHLNPESKMAFYYITGWRRKVMSYPHWRKQRVYRGKKKILTTKK